MRSFSSLFLKHYKPWLGPLALGMLAPITGRAQTFAITERNPAPNAVATPISRNIALSFNQNINASSANNVRVFSSQRGGQLVRNGNVTVSGNTLTVNPALDLRPGETVQVTVPTTVRSSAGTALSKRQTYQFTAATAPASGNFGEAISAQAGIFPIKVVSGDINGDGNPDLLASNYNGSSLSIYLGTGTGSLNSPTTITGFNSINHIALGDLNNDGRLDVAVNTDSNDVMVLLNTGTANLFGAANAVTVGASASALALGDVNNDGILDLVAAQTKNGTGTTVRVLFGVGNGTFGTATSYATGVGPFSVTLADFNNDGYLDILTSDFSNGSGTASVSVLLNAGNGTFGTFTSFATAGKSVRRACAADFNGDGNLDIAAIASASKQISVLLGTGTGSFGPKTDFASNGTSDLTVGDVDGDGNLDLVTPGNLFLGNGQGLFSTPTIWDDGGAQGLSLADFDNDGRLDLAAANGNANTVSIRLGLEAVKLNSLSSSSGPVGTRLILTGTNLSGATAVHFNGATTTSLTVNSATQLTTTVPRFATTGNVTVTTANGSTSNGLLYTVTIPDLVVSTGTATSPVSIAAGTYNSITIASGGVGQLTGAVVVNTSLNVQGTLHTNCQTLTGAGSFTLAAGGTLGICDLAGIAANGSIGAVRLTGPRLFSPNASYVYNGGDSQVTGSGLPNQVRSLTTTNSSTVRLSSPLQVSQVLTVAGRGNFDLNGQPLTLLSNAAGSALVVNAGSGIVSGGTATVQRYLDPTFNTGLGYRHYSAPVSGSTIGDLTTTTDFAPIINPAYNSSATPGAVTPFPTVFGYDQSRLSSSTSNNPAFDKGFYSPNDLTEELLVGQGYAVQIGADQLVDFTGQLNTGTKTLTLGRNADATAADAGWALVGNPYPAPLDWSQVAVADRTNLDGSIYVVQSSGPYSGSYRTYVNNVSTTGTNSPLIGVGQGFFVRVSSGQTSGTLTFRNSQRVTDYTSQAPVYRTSADVRPLVQLELRTSTGQADGLAVYAETGATPSFDAQFDAGKLVNSTGLNLASLSAAQEPLSIDGRPAFTAATVVPLTVGVPAAGTYSLAVATLYNLPAGLDAYLTDAQTGQTVRLAQQQTYSFNVTAAESMALLTGRFTLSFKGAAPLATAPAVPTITEVALYPNPTSERFTVLMPAVAGASQVQATLSNALGQVVRRQTTALPTTGATLTVETAGLPTGVYSLRLQAGARIVAKRIIIK